MKNTTTKVPSDSNDFNSEAKYKEIMPNIYCIFPKAA